jgi:hypothetical protein
MDIVVLNVKSMEGLHKNTNIGIQKVAEKSLWNLDAWKAQKK